MVYLSSYLRNHEEQVMNLQSILLWNKPIQFILGIAFIDNIKNLFFCSQQYYDEHNLNGYIFNSEIKTSERKNGSTAYYGLSELTFSTDIGDVAITKEVRITDEADNGHFDDWGDYIEESFAPNENEIYISRKLYKKLFGVSYDANSADSHLGSTIDISLRENGSEKIRCFKEFMVWHLITRVF